MTFCGGRTSAGAAGAPEPAASAGPEPGARVYLAPGRLFASAEPAQVTTILGSCVAVCLWDAGQGVGGMNHFLLPQGLPPSPRFGDAAVPLLVEWVTKLGAQRSALRAKIIGGACVLEAFREDAHPLGARNVLLAREALRAAHIPVVCQDVGGRRGRKLVFDVQTGSTWVRAIEAGSEA